jgi:RNA polymerase sigma factor (TIGR02999 family)
MDSRAQVTLLLVDAKNGNGQALDLLIPIVYDELHRLAAHYLRDEHAAATLQPTALVNEAYMRLVAQELPDWECRSHFFGVAAHLMRQILVDHARRHRSQKRGGGTPPLPLSEVLVFAPGRSDDLLALDEALTALAAVDERKSRVIELAISPASASRKPPAPSTCRLARSDANSASRKRGCIANCRGNPREPGPLAGDRRPVRAGAAAALRRPDRSGRSRLRR